MASISLQVHLISLRRNTSPSAFISKLRGHGIDPLIIGRPVEWIILPSIAEYMWTHDWDVFFVLDSTHHLPSSLESLTDAIHKVGIHMPVTLPYDFRQNNQQLLQVEAPPLQHLPHKPLRSLTSQRHHLSPSLIAFANSDLCPKGPVSMLNYVSYQPWPHAAESYQKYIEICKSGPLKRVGGRVKLIGSAHRGPEKGEWDEIVLAQYPSLKHYCDMGCDPEYQDANYKYRLPILRDLCILMTTEVDLDWTIQGSEKVMQEDTRTAVVIQPSA